MKIIIASGIYPPDIGGPAIYSQFVAKELKKKKHDVSVICYSNISTKQSDQTFKVIRILRKYPKPVRYLLYFLNLLKISRDSDIIYVQGPINSGFPAVLVSKILKTKVLIRLGGDYIWDKVSDEKQVKLTLRQYYSSGIFRKQGFIFRIFKWVLKSVDLIIFSTEFQRDIYLKYLGLEKKKTVIIKNAFPDFKKASQGFSRPKKILFAGRLIKVKNLDVLIKVFSRVLYETGSSIQLKIVGEGPEKKELQGLIQELHLEENVILKNKISNQNLLKLIQKSYFVVLPSLTEISPNLVLECIKLNKPILCTQETGLYRDFENDLVFFDPLDEEDFFRKFKWLLDEKNYKEYCKKLTRIKTDRSWQELVQEHILIFESLI